MKLPRVAPWQAAREVALFGTSLAGAAAVERRGPAAVARVREERLRRVLEAASKTRLYAPWLDDEAVRAGRLDAVPPMSKADYIARLEDSVVDGDVTRVGLERWLDDKGQAGQLFQGKYIAAMTSGTTGQVGVFLNDLGSWARMRALTFARIFRDRLSLADMGRAMRERRYRMAFIVADNGHYMTSLLARRVPRAGALVLDARAISIEMPVPAMVGVLNEMRPHLLHSYPTLLELLAHEARAGALRIAPDLITAGSEPLTASCRAALEEGFPGSQLVETYASTECVSMATGCAVGALHVNEDACVLEAVDLEGRPVPRGTRGERLLVTNLLNTAQPVVRYQLTDQAQLDDAPCPCGSPFGRIQVHGRTDDTFFLRDPSGAYQAHPPIPLEICFLAVPGLLQYQLLHERQNQLSVRYVMEGGASRERVEAVLQAQLERYLADHSLETSVGIALEPVARIERAGQGRKVRQIVSLVPRPEGAVAASARVRERRRRPRDPR